jgi:hypothetical protein
MRLRCVQRAIALAAVKITASPRSTRSLCPKFMDVILPLVEHSVLHDVVHMFALAIEQ